MTGLRTTHTSSVTEDQIDHLGHMNVRFYAVNAQAGTDAVLRELPGWGDGAHLVHDVYTRHHREQLLGTPLEVRSAILGADESGLRLHHELRAADSDVLAATFVHRVSPLGPGGERLPLGEVVIEAATAEAIALPDYALPRSISIEADMMVDPPSLEEVRARGLAMRKERFVSAEETDDTGAYRVDMAPFLSWAGEPLEGEEPEFLYESPDGRLMGWASMETRIQIGHLPRRGDRVQSFGAGIAIHDKVTHRVQWAYDVDTGALLTAFELISMAFDINGRRAMSIPDGYRRRALETLQPDLAPRAPVR